MSERSISIENLNSAILTGEIIKQYEDDTPYPSCMLLGMSEQDKYIHIVASVDTKYVYVITAYYPDENEWEADLKSRKGKRL